MNERQLRCFLSVVDCGTVSGAAQELYLGQPTVTYQIQSLEKELHCTLFERTPSGLTPTKEGRALVPHVRTCLASMAAACKAVADMQRETPARIRICHCQSIHDPLYSPFVAQFSEKHPDVEVVTTFGLLDDEMHWPKADVYLTPAKVKPEFYPPSTQRSTLYDAWTYAIVDQAHPLAQRSAISIQDCRPYPLVFPSKPFMDRCDNWYWPYIHERLDTYHPEYREERTVHEIQMTIFHTNKVFFSRGVHMNLAPGLSQIPFTAETPRLRTMICTRLESGDDPSAATPALIGSLSREMREYYRERADAFVPSLG